MRTCSGLLLAAVGALGAATAHADPIRWTYSSTAGGFYLGADGWGGDTGYFSVDGVATTPAAGPATVLIGIPTPSGIFNFG